MACPVTVVHLNVILSIGVWDSAIVKVLGWDAM
jgi:hypothetical protein